VVTGLALAVLASAAALVTLAAPSAASTRAGWWPERQCQMRGGQARSTWVALDQAVDDVFAEVIRNGVTATAIVAIANARDTFWDALQPADLPWRS
jgi:hypothetical protein